MPKNESSTAVSPLFRVVAVAILFLSVTVCGLQVLAAMSSLDHATDSSTPQMPTAALFVSPLLTLIAGIGLAAVLEGIARLVGARQSPAEDSTAPALLKAMKTLSDLQNALPKLIADAVQHVNATLVRPEAPAPPGDIAPANALEPGVEQHLARMVTLMEEMKEVSLLDDSQRKTRRQNASQRRKTARLEDAARFIQAGQWEQADALLHLLESLHPGDPEVLAIRNHLDDSRILHQADGWDHLKPQVDDLMKLSKYAEAIELTNGFLDRFPNHLDCQQLTEQVKREQQIYIEANSNQLYEDLKAAVENRQWRKALDCIQQFLASYPDHPRAGKIRQQVRVVQKNAEIEERHVQEERIREFITSRRYSDAADLAEDLLERFPDSPQAAYLTELLPKLRERSVTEGAEIRS